MIIGTGIDIAEVPRIRAAFERFGARFLHRIYTDIEIAYVERKANRFERYAARFAAKEAGMKALGTGVRGVGWKDLEVVNARSGRPTLRFHGRAKKIAESKNVGAVNLSLTHTKETAMAFVVLEAKENEVPF